MNEPFHPNEADHTVISQRYIVKADSLPEDTVQEISEKQKALKEEKDAAESTADLDLLADKTDMSMVKVYENAEKTKIFPNREKQIDKELRAKGAKITTTIARLEDKKNAIKQIKDQITTSAGDSFATVIRASTVKSASDYLKDSGPRKRASKRRRKVTKISAKGSHR